MADTRKDKRAHVSLKVRFKSATVDEFIEHYSKDVSRGGIFIKSSQPMPIGTLLKFQFQLKDESALIKGVGRVVWTRAEDRAGADRPAGMGIKFIKMDNESRAMVDRIVESHAGGTNAFEDGRADQGPPPSDAPPPKDGESFFPDMGPAELPPPEDRTAVRQAAQFLAAALSEVSDEAAAREAEQKAEEALQRTAQLEAQRIAAAEGRAGDSLPSMIIHPDLSVPPAAGEPPAPILTTPAPPPVEELPTAGGQARPKPASLPPAAKGPSLPPPAAEAATAAAQSSAPPPKAASEPPQVPEPAPAVQPAIAHVQATRRSPWLPIAAILIVLGVAAFVALRGGPAEVPTGAAAAPAEAEPERVAQEPAAPPTPDPAEETAQAEAAEAEEEIPTFEPDPEPVELVQVRVTTQPAGAEVSVDGVVKGNAPLTLDLEKGTAVSLTATSPGYVAATNEFTPGSGGKSQRLVLTALPYVLHLETTPPGASISVAGKRTTTPGEITWPRAPSGALKVSAKLPGYEPATTVLMPEAFQQSGDAMRAAVQLSLNELPEKPVAAPKPKPAPVAAQATEDEEPEPAPRAEAEPAEPPAPEAPVEAPPAQKAEAEPEPAPAPKAAKVEEPKPAAPAPVKTEPETAPEKKAQPEPLPDNPFG